VQIRVIIHKAEEEATGRMLRLCLDAFPKVKHGEVTRNIREAIQSCLSVSVDESPADLANLVEITV
jgi:hypothetical protein